MNDASKVPTAGALDAEAQARADPAPASRLGLYFAVGLAAGSVIALQIDVMRVFAVGSWAHFGSLVVSLAMLGFGLASAVMTVARSDIYGGRIVPFVPFTKLEGDKIVGTHNN